VSTQAKRDREALRWAKKELERAEKFRADKAKQVAEQRKRSAADPHDLGGDSKLGL
jgi:hypothetical protein